LGLNEPVGVNEPAGGKAGDFLQPIAGFVMTTEGIVKSRRLDQSYRWGCWPIWSESTVGVDSCTEKMTRRGSYGPEGTKAPWESAKWVKRRGRSAGCGS